MLDRLDYASQAQAWLTARPVQQVLRRLLLGYALLSLFGVVGLAALFFGTSAGRGVAALGAGQGSSIDFVAFALSWLLIGAILWCSQQPRLIRDHLPFLAGFFFVSFGYLNTIREPHQVLYGDFPAYFLAARNMYAGIPWGQTLGTEGPLGPYLYPPLLATLLAPFTPFGLDRLVQVFDIFNYFAVLALQVLLYLVLRRYGFSSRGAAVASFLALIVNVAILRTLIYRQVNLHVLNLLLLSLAAYGLSTPLSAAALGLAVQLKVSPLLLVLTFVYMRDWWWLCCFVATQVVIVLATSVATSPTYYVQFLSQVADLHETATRNVGVDVVLYNVVNFLPDSLSGALRPWETQVAVGLRVVLAAVTLLATWRLVRGTSLTIAANRRRVLLGGFVGLPVGMLLAAPTIWEHHFVFVVLTVLVLLPALREAWEFVVWGLGYVFMFLQPVYDVFPVSYTRLAGLLFVLVLLHRVANRVAARGSSALTYEERGSA
jgi:alpha-1,2-mannosyltransferase